MNIRSLLYGAAKVLGDINAIKRGKVPERIIRRTAGKITSQLLGKLPK